MNDAKLSILLSDGAGRQTAFMEELVDLDEKPGCLPFLTNIGLERIPVVRPLKMAMLEEEEL